MLIRILLLILYLMLTVTVVVVAMERLINGEVTSSYPTECRGNCDEWHIVIAILVTNSTTGEDFENLKKFIQLSVGNCMEKHDGQVSVKVLLPGSPFSSRWCRDLECMHSVLTTVDPLTHSLPMTGPVSENDTQTQLVAKFGRELLHPSVLIEDRIPELLLSFAEEFDVSRSMRLHLSQTHFRIFVVDAPVDFYRDNSSLSNADLEFFPNFAELAEFDANLCEDQQAEHHSTTATSSSMYLFFAAAAMIILQSCIVFVFLLYKFKRVNKKNKVLQFTVIRHESLRRINSNGETLRLHSTSCESPQVYRFKRDDWEIKPEKLVVRRNVRLGNGSSGEVFKGTIIGKAPITIFNRGSYVKQRFADCDVAVKVIPGYADAITKSAFLNEISIMKKISYHPNIVNLVGCITEGPSVCLVMEYAHYGDMVQFLRSRRSLGTLQVPGQMRTFGDLTVKDMIAFGWQISEGMNFLSMKGFIHRDLAGRNILVDESLKAMISDFGLCIAPDMCSNKAATTRDRLPVKWCSPEALSHLSFSTKSDVWSFGVVLYEIFSMGAVPYEDVPGIEMVQYLTNGSRLQRPILASTHIYNLMTRCWAENPDRRPSFSQLSERLTKILNNATENYDYLDLTMIDVTGQKRSTRSFESTQS